LAKLEAILAGHHHVADDDVGDKFERLFDALLPIGGGYNPVMDGEYGRQVGDDVPVVLHQQYNVAVVTTP
jgi:hypothetical protein